MRINVDLQRATALGTGIGEYTVEIAKSLAKIKDAEVYGMYFNEIKNQQLKKNKNYFSSLPLPVNVSIIPSGLAYKVELPLSYEFFVGKKSNVNLFLNYRIPKLKFNAPVVSTIYDILAFKVPMENQEIVKYQKQTLEHTIKNSDHILTCSNNSKRDIIEWYNLPEDMVSVIYPGVDYNSFNSSITEEEKTYLSKKYNLPNNFILYFGGQRKHKNIEQSLEAYSKTSKNFKEKYKFVITGKSNMLEEYITHLNIQSDVIFTGFVDDEDKVGIYQLAKLTSFMSTYEGFGLGLIESMAAGTPCIISDIPVFREVANGAAEIVELNDSNSLAKKFEELCTNDSRRSKLIKLGQERARFFNWDKSGIKLFSILQQVYNQKQSSVVDNR